MSNPYLSLTDLAAIETLADANQMMVITSDSGVASVGYVDLSDFRDEYLLVTVNEQITALQNRPGNGSFASPVTMSVTGVVTGSVEFDGSENFTLNLTMPDNSIPISAVEDLASTIAALQTDVSFPDFLGVSYYSNLNATSQSSVLGYWNSSSTNTTGQDSTGVILTLASDGNPYPDASNYLNQLCFGSNGTLIWRRNPENGAWTQVSLWHSGNLTPSNYLTNGGSGTLQSLSILGTASGTVAAVISQDATGSDLQIKTGSTNQYTFLFDHTGNLNVPNNLFATNIVITNSIGMGASGGIEWNGGQEIITNANGGLQIGMESTGTILLALLNAAGTSVVHWDSAGNYNASTNYVSTGAIQVASGVITGRLALNGVGSGNGNGANNPTAALQVNTSSGMIYIDELNGSSSIVAANAANTGFTQMNLQASAFSFNGGNAAFAGAVGVNGTAAGTGGSGFAANTGFGLLLARGASGVNYWDSVTTSNGAYQALQINATSITLAAATTVSGSLTVNSSLTVNTTSTHTGLATFNAGVTVNGGLGAFTDAIHITGSGVSGAGSGGQGAYIGWNQTAGDGEMDFVNNQGGGIGGFYWYNTNSTGGSVTNPMQLTSGGALTTSGVANFNTSDRRLKKNIKPLDVVPYHRLAPYYSYERKDIDAKGQGPMAQDVFKINPAHVNEYHHMNGRTRRHVKRLAIDKTGIALEQAYWASYEVDDLREVVTKLLKRVKQLEAKQKLKKSGRK
jgi:hypothetical protein